MIPLNVRLRFGWRGVVPPEYCKYFTFASAAIFSALMIRHRYSTSLARLFVFVLRIKKFETAVLITNKLDSNNGEM